MNDKFGYLTNHKIIDQEKLALCEKIFSNCDFDDCKYTIIIPEYRRPITTREAVLSAVNQDYEGLYEVLVTSDGIAPEEYETESIVREIAKKYNKLSYYRNKINVGMFQNWNNCICNAKGKWIVILPDDDMLSPYFLSTIDRFIRENDYSGMIGVNPHKVYGKKEYHASDFEKPNDDIKVKCIDKYGVFFDDGISITGMTFIKKSVIELGGFQSDFYPVADSVCMINFGVKGQLVRLCCDISAYRIDENVSQSKGVLEKIVLYAARMKETVSSYDRELSWFYKCFKSEIIHDYIVLAEKTWNTKINRTDVADEVKIGFEYSSVKYYLMRLIRKIIRKRHNC